MHIGKESQNHVKAWTVSSEKLSIENDLHSGKAIQRRKVKIHSQPNSTARYRPISVIKLKLINIAIPEETFHCNWPPLSAYRICILRCGWTMWSSNAGTFSKGSQIGISRRSNWHWLTVLSRLFFLDNTLWKISLCSRRSLVSQTSTVGIYWKKDTVRNLEFWIGPFVMFI